MKHLLRIEERVFHVVVDNTDAIRGMVADIKGALTPPGASFSSTLRMSQLSLDNRAFT